MDDGLHRAEAPLPRCALPAPVRRRLGRQRGACPPAAALWEHRRARGLVRAAQPPRLPAFGRETRRAPKRNRGRPTPSTDFSRATYMVRRPGRSLADPDRLQRSWRAIRSRPLQVARRGGATRRRGGGVGGPGRPGGGARSDRVLFRWRAGAVHHAVGVNVWERLIGSVETLRAIVSTLAPQSA